jgi:AdoMet-dependent heme synthase
VTRFAPHLRRVYWESTASCNLRCIHCRRLDVLDKPSPEELTTAQAKSLIDEIATFGRTVFIFSGGEPLVRPDLFELAAYAREKGLPIALSTNGTLVTPELAQKIKDTGIYYASVSLDGATAETHDLFRGTGAFDKTIKGMDEMLARGIKVQINFTVTKMNVKDVPAVYELARAHKAIALYLFLLVPVGCGVEIAESQMLSKEEVEEWLRWVVQKDTQGPLPLKAICAPQYFRVEHEANGNSETPIATDRKGCLAGLHMCFVSHKGEVFPCGYLPIVAGNVKDTPFSKIWTESKALDNLRDSGLLTGRCGGCGYKDVCGGCRARGYFAYGDVLAEEPYCVYDPPSDVIPAVVGGDPSSS